MDTEVSELNTIRRSRTSFDKTVRPMAMEVVTLDRRQWLERQRQWERFAAKERGLDLDEGDLPTRLRRVGEMMDFWLRCARERDESDTFTDNNGPGVCLMHERLRKVRAYRDRI